MTSKANFDLLAALIEEWLPLDIDPGRTSDDAKLLALAQMAVGEQLKELRSDLSELKKIISLAGKKRCYDPHVHLTDADFEEMGREAMQESDEYSRDDCRDADYDPHNWTDEDAQDMEGGSDER